MELKPYIRNAYYYETDRMDIVHHSNYVRWLEEARVDMMEQMGFPFADIEKLGVVVPVLSVETHYKHPVRFGDTFSVEAKLVYFNGCKFELDYEVTNLSTNLPSLTAHTSHCFTDVNLKPVRIKKYSQELFDLYNQYCVK